MKKKQKKSQIIMMTTLAVFGIGLVLGIIGMSKMVKNIDEVVISKEPEVILASAGVESGADIDLPVTYYDQRQDACVNLYDMKTRKELAERQFEWSSCGYTNEQLEQGMVGYNLNGDYLPVATGGDLLSNRGLTDMTRWFNEVDGKSKAYTGTVRLSYLASDTTEFTFVSDEFYPLDTAEFSKGDEVNKDGHNHLFTMGFAVPFTVMTSGEESFEIVADDDSFVYVGSELALDLGGIHEAMSGKFEIKNNGEVFTAINGQELAYSGIKINQGDGALVRIFHADRDSADGSVFKIKMRGMNLNLVQTQLANSNSTSVQVAYDPNDPSYVGPLGESSVIKPDGTRGYIIAATILSVVIMACAIFTVISLRALIKAKR